MKTKLIMKWAAAATLACITTTLSAQTLVQTLIDDTFPTTIAAGQSIISSSGTYQKIKSGYNSPSVAADSIAGVNSLRLRPASADYSNREGVFYRAFNDGTTLTLGNLLDGESIKVSVTVDFVNGSNANIGNFYFGLVGWLGNDNAGNSSLVGVDIGNSGGRLVSYGTDAGAAFLGANGTATFTPGTTLADWASPLATKQLYTLTYTIANSGGDFYLDYLVNNTSVLGGARQVDLSAYTATVVNGISFRLAAGDVDAYISGVNVSVLSVPEPSAWMLLGSSVALLAFLRRRK